MITIGFFNTPRTTGSIAAIFIPLLSADCRGNRIKKCKRKNSWLPVVGRSAEPLDIVATRILPLVTIYVCRLRGRGKMSVSANRPSPSRRLYLLLVKRLPRQTVGNSIKNA